MSTEVGTEQIDSWAKVLWDYMQLHQALKPAEAILILGNDDRRTAERGIEVWQQKLAPQIIISGGFGKITKDWSQPEAEVFATKLLKAGVSPEIMLLETTSTNTGENFQFTKQLITTKSLTITSAIIVTKPYMERRALATAQQVWPEATWQVTSIQKSYEEYTGVMPATEKDGMLHLMVGDVQRMWEYANRGWQVPVDIPGSVREAWQQLVTSGYTKELVQ